MSKYDIIQIIFKCCVSQIYLIVLILNLNARMIISIIPKRKLELFIVNWYYSYNK